MKTSAPSLSTHARPRSAERREEEAYAVSELRSSLKEAKERQNEMDTIKAEKRRVRYARDDGVGTRPAYRHVGCSKG